MLFVFCLYFPAETHGPERDNYRFMGLVVSRLLSAFWLRSKEASAVLFFFNAARLKFVERNEVKRNEAEA